MIFDRNIKKAGKALVSDFHSHLIPNIDDGVKDFPEAVAIIALLKQLGVKTVVTTPHVSQHAYPNTAGTIQDAFSGLQHAVSVADAGIELFVAAEYYLDDGFQEQVQRNERLLTFGRNHLLFETNYFSEPLQLSEVVFQLVTQGYRPMLAHPERYHFMTLEKAEGLRDRGVNLQLNLLSLTGYYSQPVVRLAEKLIDAKLINAVSSDSHRLTQAKLLGKVAECKYYRRVLELPLINFNLHA